MQGYKENRSRFPKTIKTDIFRLDIEEDKIIIEFGVLSHEKEEIEVVFSSWVEPKIFFTFVYRCVEAGLAYQGEYKENIGFKDSKAGVDENSISDNQEKQGNQE